MTDPIGSAVAGFLRGMPSATGSIQDSGSRTVPVLGDKGDGGSFADSLTRALNSVSDSQATATETLQAFLRGDNVELHQVMAATEEAQISLEMLIEVRNKFTEAYRTLTTMQG